MTQTCSSRGLAGSCTTETDQQTGGGGSGGGNNGSWPENLRVVARCRVKHGMSSESSCRQ